MLSVVDRPANSTDVAVRFPVITTTLIEPETLPETDGIMSFVAVDQTPLTHCTAPLGRDASGQGHKEVQFMKLDWQSQAEVSEKSQTELAANCAIDPVDSELQNSMLVSVRYRPFRAALAVGRVPESNVFEALKNVTPLDSKASGMDPDNDGLSFSLMDAMLQVFQADGMDPLSWFDDMSIESEYVVEHCDDGDPKSWLCDSETWMDDPEPGGG